MSHHHRILATTTAVIVAAVCAITEPALAAGSADVGRNLGDWLRDQLAPIYFAMLGVGALGFVFARKFAALSVWLAVMMVVGLCVLSPDIVGSIVRGVGRQL